MTQSAAILQNSKSSRITHVQFGLLNPDEVRRQSVVPITTSTLYTRMLPTVGGLNDLRMGTCDRRLYCGTCRHDVIKCPGHFGHLDLAVPSYHVSMASIIMKVLRCVCFFCSELLVEIYEDDPRVGPLVGRDRLNLVSGLCKSRRPCRGCGGSQPKYVFVRATTSITLDTTDMKFGSEEEEEYLKKPFTAARARAILVDISDTNVRLLGSNPTFARPEWMVLTVLQIPPPISRPCITASDGSRTKGQDDVTIKLIEIFKANKVVDTLLRASGATSGFMPDGIFTEWTPGEPWALNVSAEKGTAIYTAIDMLQAHLMQYFHHGAPVDAKGGGGRSHARALRLIPERWRGKKGRFRGNLAGKRVNHSSRTVASPAPDYDVDELGVPAMVANHLTFPERVTPYNLDLLTACVHRGPGIRDGASAVIVPGGDSIDLSLCEMRDTLVLEVGWIVERHLWDGDWVLLNRQPSLHRMSIMAHRIRIIGDRTFRLPVCDTTPYNADFDGDELNIHVLQTHDARAEAACLMSVTTQMINPENNKPIVALVQDSLVAAFLLTQRDTFLRRDQVMQLMMDLRYLEHGPMWLPPPALLKPVPLWTGKQLLTLLFPAHLVYTAVVRSGRADGVGAPGGEMDVWERRVVVRRGELLAGTLCKKTLGTSAGGLVHILVRDWGFTRAANFVSDAQRILRGFMMIRGFSVGVGDCVMSADAHRRVDDMLNRTFAHADRVRHDAAGAPPALVDACVTKMLGSLLTRGGAEVVKDTDVLDNNIGIMIECGAKGSAINIAQILSCVGQQSVEGGRIRLGVGDRTLPCFRRGDDSAGARGFVCNSYGTGLTAQEYFFHAMGGREGLVDTAVKTASTGYIQRRLSKAQEGLQVAYDATVRNSSGNVIQFYYGGDSYYPTKLECASLPTFGMTNAEVRAAVVGHAAEWEAVGVDANVWMGAQASGVATILAERDTIRTWQCAMENAPEGKIVMPVNPRRVMKRAVAKYGRHLPTAFSSPLEVSSAISDLLDRIEATRRPYATFITRAYIRATLTPRDLVVVHCLSREGVAWVCDQLWFHFNEALAEPGEMVGTVGASSIGAPCTQMTLNTFHTAGVLAHTVTQGVPRLKELIDLTVKISTPSCRVVMEEPYSTHEHMARALGAGIEYTILHQVVATTEVVWSPPGEPVTGDDEAMVELHAALNDTGREKCNHSVLRFVLDRTSMCRKQLSVGAVGEALASYLGDNAVVIWSEVNMLNWCVRVRLKGLDLAPIITASTPDEAYDLEMKASRTVHDFLLDNVPIHGVGGITRVLVCKENVRVPDPATGALVSVVRWSADTEGTNLHALLALDGVDSRRTHTNDIYETLNVLGVEAATHQLLTEIREVLSHDGAYVNDRHLQLLVDVMTHRGDLAPVTRHSMLKLGASVYTRASFEQTQDVLTWAAAMGSDNPTHGVTENIMLGTPISGGTGACDIITHAHARPPVVNHTRPVKPLIRKNQQRVAPLNRMPCKPVRSLVTPPDHREGFVGKKRRVAEGRPEGRNFVLHSPTLKRGVRMFLPHSPTFK